jgi:beta-carotene hydroxylase
MLLTFFTYASTSHDLVHRTLGLPPWLNDAMLALIEALALRSGHGYRLWHLHHHRNFPREDDVEGSPARMPWWRALLEGPLYLPRLHVWALHRASASLRPWIVAEMLAAAGIVAAAWIRLPRDPVLAIYVALVVAGTWIFPFALVMIPHDARAKGPLFQTRAFRGRLVPMALLHHTYHLEHHLYPAVPAHNWRRLALRLDPHLRAAGVKPIHLV